MSVQIVKADGTVEPFKVGKLQNSLRRAGAPKSEIKRIIEHITPELHDGITTQNIYRHAFKLLRESKTPAAARYSLRRALFSLGPTGFPFEDYLTRLYRADGYNTRTRTLIKGKCATHELDIGAYKRDHSFVAEAKFHSRPGNKSDLQVVMYSYARFLDLSSQRICKDDICGISEYWVITNTKFTSSAEKYGECVGLRLLSWDYPRKDNLHDLIERTGRYPITVLQTLSTSQKRALIERNAIVCSDILEKPHFLKHLHINARKTEAVVSEARQLCQGG